jgi:RimJ/RimL family protein N-acetyltransferase
MASSEARDRFAADLRRILSPAVVRHLPPTMQPEQTDDAISDWMVDLVRDCDVYTVRLTARDVVVGLLILAPDAVPTLPPSIHLGYLLDEAAWGQGLATELLRGVLNVARDRGPITFLGGVARENHASASVLRKLGFQECPGEQNEETMMFRLSIPGS